jgi:hypothetical protein
VFLKLQAVGLTQGNSFDFPITQGEIAGATGIATVHVNRSIQRLRAENLIELDNRRCTIANWDKLKQKVASLPVLFEQWSRSQGSLLPHVTISKDQQTPADLRCAGLDPYEIRARLHEEAQRPSEIAGMMNALKKRGEM